MNKVTISLFLAASLWVPSQVTADLQVILSPESSIPTPLSPKKDSNSPKNFDNSLDNPRNSTSEFSNSTLNPSNRSAAKGNGIKGNNRLLLKDGSKYRYIGYWVKADTGVVNLFSPSVKVKRLFYSPPNTGAIFDAEEGTFCGTISLNNNKAVLLITNEGYRAFIRGGVSFKGPGEFVTPGVPGTSPSAKAPSANAPSAAESGGSDAVTDLLTGLAGALSNSPMYAGVGGGHWIKKNVESGKLIILEDGSIWQIDPYDKITASLWLPITEIVVLDSESGSPSGVRQTDWHLWTWSFFGIRGARKERIRRFVTDERR